MVKKAIALLVLLMGVSSAALAAPISDNDPLLQSPGPNGNGAGDGTGPINQSLLMVGEAWSGSGTIVAVTPVGVTLELSDGSQIYLELGPIPFLEA